MIRYKLKSPTRPAPLDYPRREAFMILRVESRGQEARIEFEGDPVLIGRIEQAMSLATGEYGRSIDKERASPDDLAILVTQPPMICFEAELLEGDDLINRNRP